MSGYEIVHIDFAQEFKPGDPRPIGYIEFMNWAEAQIKGGLRQTRCRMCGLWRFPQEKCCKPKGGTP